MKILILPTIALLMATPTFAARSNWTVKDHVPLDQFIVQAHRGAGVLAPENTIEAFELGWKLNCIPESDVRTTNDGVIVAFHDNNFARVVVGVSEEMAKKGVKDVSFEELAKFDVGDGRHVKRMTDVFKVMQSRPERRLYMDIKQVDLEQLAKEVKEYGVEKQIIFTSPKYAEIRAWKAMIPDSQTLLWMGGTEESLEKKFVQLRESDFKDVTQLQIHVHLHDGQTTIQRDAADPFKESDAFLIAHGEEVRKHGILYQTLPYGGETTAAEIYWKLLDLGFMSFATDHPDVTWDVVKKYYEAK
jgi:glycerophosphoryl diester phosphodiesterase